MTLGSYSFGLAFMASLCFKLFHGASGDCGPPPVKQNTIPVAETSGTTGQTVLYTCDRSTNYYEIPGRSTTITCQADGTWTDIEDFCTRACGVPERIPFAEPRDGELDKDIFLPDAVVRYSCRPGYVRAPGTQNFITCLETYIWSTPEEFCSRKSCGYPGDLENGEFKATDLFFGSRVTYACNKGYRLSSRRNYRDCQADGTWSNAVPQCEARICSAPAVPVNGDLYPQKEEYTYLDSVKFSCNKPYEVSGIDTIFCTETGEWSAGTPTCKEVSCSNPVVYNATRTSGFVGPYNLNSAINFMCNSGYILNGSNSIKCNIDSQWEPAIPTCDRISCGHPGTIENGQSSSSDFFIGSKVTYTCNKGYTLTLPVNYRICQENGIWTGSTPKCEAFCVDPPTFPFATKHTYGHDGKYFNGTNLHYVCNPGFKIGPGKESHITCTVDGWSRLDEFCMRVSCGDLEKNIKNGYVRYSDTLFGSRATYTCEEGYVRNSTEDYRECKADGTWSTPIACSDESQGSHLGPGAKAGIALGSLAGVAIIVVTLWKIISKQQKKGPTVPEVL